MLRYFVAVTLVVGGSAFDLWGTHHFGGGHEGHGIGGNHGIEYGEGVKLTKTSHVSTSHIGRGPNVYMGLGGISPDGHHGSFLGIGHGIYPGISHAVHTQLNHVVHTAIPHSMHAGIGHEIEHHHHQFHLQSAPHGHKQVSSVAVNHHVSTLGAGGLTSVTHTVNHQHTIGDVGSFGHLQSSTHTTIVKHLSPLSTLYGGYYGGVLAYPMATGMNKNHVSGSITDLFKGYYGGYFPGSFGYGQSYQFLH